MNTRLAIYQKINFTFQGMEVLIHFVHLVILHTLCHISVLF
jgi:hypothetical protein